MTAEELNDIRERLGLGPVAMSRAMGVSYTTYRDWASGKTRVHPAAARCAELLLEFSSSRISELTVKRQTAAN